MNALTVLMVFLVAGWEDLPSALSSAAKSFAAGIEQAQRDAAPNVAIFFVSGHTGLIEALPNAYPYLARQFEAGPEITSSLTSAGYRVVSRYYVDSVYPANGFGGYLALLGDIRAANTQWSKYGTRIIVVSHSHGGVWAHAAIEVLAEVVITCTVDLDTSSFGWDLLHRGEAPFGDPRDRYYMPFNVTYPNYLGLPSESSQYYDIEDVVFPNVVNALEVRSGAPAPALNGEWYDERWNVRRDGRNDNLSGYFSASYSHTEVERVGPTLSYVEQWILERLRTSQSVPPPANLP
jgi:hypothetical protein